MLGAVVNLSEENSVDIDYLQQQEARSQYETESLPETFFEEFNSIVEAIASSVAGKGSLPTGIEFDDLKSWGTEGLIKAYRNYDKTKGSQFKTYAYYRIRGEIYDRVRAEWQYRNPREYQKHRKEMQEKVAEVIEDALDSNSSGRPLEQSISDVLASSAVVCLMSLDNIENVEGIQDQNEQEDQDDGYNILWEEVETLDMEERQLIKLFYNEGLKQKEIAERLNYSRSKVCRIHMKALEKLKKSLEKKYGEDLF